MRDLRAVTLPEGRVKLYFRAPARSGNPSGYDNDDLKTFQYRYTSGTVIDDNQDWLEMPDHLVSHRFLFIDGLTVDKEYTFQVRAVNHRNARGYAPHAQTRATPCCPPDDDTEDSEDEQDTQEQQQQDDRDSGSSGSSGGSALSPRPNPPPLASPPPSGPTPPSRTPRPPGRASTREGAPSPTSYSAGAPPRTTVTP